MFYMKKALIAIDYNPCAKKVAEMGYEFARSMNAEVCIVHAIADISYYSMEYVPLMGFEGFSPDCVFKSTDEQKLEAKRFLAAVVTHLSDSKIKTMVLNGKTSKVILEFAEGYKADLIVMGTHSHNAFEKTMGDVTARLIKHTKIPVLVIPTDSKDLHLSGKTDEVLQYI